MNYRELGRTGWHVSTSSFGAWTIGGTWGTENDDDSIAALHRSLDLGVNFFDTADVYGDGLSERLLAQLKRERSEPFYAATKADRRLSPHVVVGYIKRQPHCIYRAKSEGNILRFRSCCRTKNVFPILHQQVLSLETRTSLQ